MDPSAIAGILVGSAVVSAFVTAVLGHWNELSRAREERRQRRLAETYIDVLKLALCIGDRAGALDPDMPEAARPKLPPMPSDEEQRTLRARLSAYGSPEMRDAYLDMVRLDRQLVEAAKARAKRLTRAKVGDLTADEITSARADVAAKAGQVRGQAVVLIELANDELAERRLTAWGMQRLRVWRLARRAIEWPRGRTARLRHRNRTSKAEG
jgi:hypothetical protein